MYGILGPIKFMRDDNDILQQSKKLYRIVIVDDEETIRTSLCSLFPWETLGFKVCNSFDNGLKALIYLMYNRCDVVLTDIKMPLFSGINLLESMRNKQINTPVVMLTAYDSFDYVQQCIRLNAVQYLMKPIRYQELVTTFENLYEYLEREREHEQRTREALPLVEASKQLIEEDHRNCDPNILSGVLHLTTADFLLQFKKQAGESFSTYTKHWKMEKAKEMLNLPIIQISEIAEVLGFTKANNFTRAFRDYFGCTPMQFRKGT
jgi:two-component system response regulator YesN